MVKTYIFDKSQGKMVEKTAAMQEPKGPHVMGDIKPYQAVGPEFGKWITSRSQHREYIKRHGLIEVGNERKEFGLD